MQMHVYEDNLSIFKCEISLVLFISLCWIQWYAFQISFPIFSNIMQILFSESSFAKFRCIHDLRTDVFSQAAVESENTCLGITSLVYKPSNILS